MKQTPLRLAVASFFLVTVAAAALTRVATAEPALRCVGALNCPVGRLVGVVRPLADTACTALVMRTDLSRVTNLTATIGCKDDSPCALKHILSHVAEEKGVPLILMYAVAWTESSWNQWKSDGRTLVSSTDDYGLMQLSRAMWGRRYDWNAIGGDTLYNARAGADVLKWSYDYARRRGFTGVNLLKATYAVYNGGPSAINRPFRQRDVRDTNFNRNATTSPWASSLQSC